MLLLEILSFVLFANVVAADIIAADGLSYEDLKHLNVSCSPKDTCAGRKPDGYPGPRFPNTCSCHADCSLLDTCCIDSPHRGVSSPSQKCGTVDFPEVLFESSGYYMVQSCLEDAVWKHLCEGDLEKDGDVLRIAPVSSLDTNTTYRNYYCFRCYEQTDNFLYWQLVLTGSSDGPKPVTNDFAVTYDNAENTWLATAVDEDIIFNVKLLFSVPLKISFPVIHCNPMVVAGCPDSWEDDDIRGKCESYTGFLQKSYGPVYRNAHCALCNSEHLDGLSCIEPKYPYVIRVFTFSYLIDVNRPGGDEVGKKSKCTEGEKWDPFGKKCRKLSCVLPGYVIKDGECHKIDLKQGVMSAGVIIPKLVPTFLKLK